MKYLIKAMLVVYIIVFIIAIFGLTGCTKYHSRSYDCPKESSNYDEMNDFDYPNKECIEAYTIKYYHFA